MSVHEPVNCDPDCVRTSCNVPALVNVALTEPVHVPVKELDDGDENGFNDESPEQPDRERAMTSQARIGPNNRTFVKIRRTVLTKRIRGECNVTTRLFS